jgi:uncharacterized membrane protein YdjX (TVP38/TMEM64 family)
MAETKDPHVPKSGWIAFFGLVETILDRFGWPGALLIFCIYFIESHATPEQKIAIINMYALGNGISVQYPMFVLGIGAVLAFFAQRFYYARKIKALKNELKRLGKWKTDHQEGRSGAPLHHSEDPEA